MNELKHIVHTARAHLDAGRSCVLASLVYRAGSTYRRPGARALVTDDGEIIGLIGGGCLEDDLVEEALAVLNSGRAVLVDFDNSAQADRVWGHGLGCAGRVGILLERLEGPQPALLEVFEQTLEHRRVRVLASLFATGQGSPLQLAQHWQLDAHGQFVALAQPETSVLPFAHDSSRACYVHEQDGNRWLVETLLPPVRLLIFGAGYDVQPVVRLADALGWDCVVHTQREDAGRILLPARRIDTPASDTFNAQYIDARTAVLLMTHHYTTDRGWLARVIDSSAAYIGALGPAQRLADMLADLNRQAPLPASLHGPAGLETGGDAPQDIALSIIAEIQSVMHDKSAGPLREKTGPIHDDRS